ncbi:MAG: hypothetical protein V4628_07195 [Pseudomonadota bacterium]
MNVGYARRLAARALVVGAVFALWGCDKSMELQDISQCVAPIEGGGLSAVPPSGLKTIPERQCFGLQWSIPLAFEPYLFGTPVENLNITLGLLDQTPGAHMTEVRKAREQPEVGVYSQPKGTEFQERILAVRKAGEEAYGLESTGGLMYNMEVLMSKTNNAGLTLVVFYPVNQGSSMVVCNVASLRVEEEPENPLEAINPAVLIQQIDPLTLCTATSYMDERLFAEYHILYSLMPQFDLINAVLINNILEFRVR